MLTGNVTLPVGLGNDLHLHQTTVTTALPLLTSDYQALAKLILEQSSLPPRPPVKIKGAHSEYGAAYGPDKTDFALTLDLTGLLGVSGDRVEAIPAYNRGTAESRKTFN